jgi:hypothetical protein
MKVPFTTEEFFKIFGDYNTGVFPIQIIFYLMAFFMIFLIVNKKTAASTIISLSLGFFWFWMGVVYHIIYFSKINPAAYIFGFFFLLQGALFIYSGVYQETLRFKFRNDLYGITGWLLVLYALLIYPLLGYINGHIYPDAPHMSAPCPTTIFTFGMLLFSYGLPKWILVIPFLWSLLGFFAAVNLSVQEDYGLFISGIIVLFMILYRDKKLKLATT